MSFINTMNNLGAKAHVDAEAEYRLLRLARNIVDAKIASSQFSTSVKASYGSSIRGVAAKGRIELMESVKLGSSVSYGWADVAHEMSAVMSWFKGALRYDYSGAFVKSVSDKEDLFGQLKMQGLTHDFMKWAFEEMRAICAKHDHPVDALIACYDRVRAYALNCHDRSEDFNKLLEELHADPNFSLYDYIFNHLALKAQKPKLFDLDEAYFAATSSFDIYYEALEQATRHAHTLVPGTHDDKLERFNLRFTDDMAVDLGHQKPRAKS